MSHKRRIILTLKAILFVCLVLGCANTTRQEERILPTWDWKEFTVVVNIVPKQQMLTKCETLGVPYRADACGRIYTDTKRCEIYVPRVDYMTDEEGMRKWGHEVMHCAYGQYHK